MNSGRQEGTRPFIAVLITTRNRRSILERTLSRLFRNEPPPGGFEVVVTDDGSEDGTAPFLAKVHPPGHVRYRFVSIPRAGTGTGFNTAAAAAEADHFLFLGDDAFVPRDLVAAHAQRLRELDDRRTAVSGRVEWSRDLPPSRFRDWLGKGIIHRHPPGRRARFAPARHFFTLNASIHRWLWERAGGFPEDVPSWIDTLFAFRASSHGMRLFYDPAVVVEHHHAWTKEAFCARRYEKGRIAARLLDSSPRFADFVEIPRPGRWRTVMRTMSRFVAGPAGALGVRAVEDWCFAHEINGAFVKGYLEAGGK